MSANVQTSSGIVVPLKITAAHLARTAYVYVRQSTATQVYDNLDSQRRQYGLAEQARQWGGHTVEVIDEDLGRSGSGRAARPCFERLVSAVCLKADSDADHLCKVCRFCRSDAFAASGK